MLDTLITSKTRVKLLLKFFINTTNRAYLRNLASEFGESSNAIRVELNRLEEAGLLESSVAGNRKYYQANTKHPLYDDLLSIMRKFVGIDKIVDNIVLRLGNLDHVYLTGALSKGIDDGVINLILVGEEIDYEYLAKLAKRAEELTQRKISHICFNAVDFEVYRIAQKKDIFLIWSNIN